MVIFLLLILPLFGDVRSHDADYPDLFSSSEIEALLSVWPCDGFTLSKTEHFLVAYNMGLAEADELANRLEMIHEHFHLYFEQKGFDLQRPTGRLSWLQFNSSELFSVYARRADRMDLSRLAGYYSARTNRVAIISPKTVSPAEPQTRSSEHSFDSEKDIAAMVAGEASVESAMIAHELAHQLAFNTGLQKRGVMYPLWASEGLATQFETDVTVGAAPPRAARLAAMRNQGRIIPLEEFVALTRLPKSREHAEDVYAQAWGFFNFILDRRTDQLRDYLSHLYSLDRGFRTRTVLQREFSDAFGPVAQLQQDWLDYLSCGL